jgi:hypothetical protein
MGEIEGTSELKVGIDGEPRRDKATTLSLAAAAEGSADQDARA